MSIFNNKLKLSLGAALMAYAAASTPVAQAQAHKFVSLGTGGVTGVYYAAGGAICRIANREATENGFRCSVESTGGSVFNINTIRAGELEFAFAQSDVGYAAYNGEGQFEGTPAEELRSLFSLHSEPLTFVVHPDANIKTFDDLKGTRFNVGNPGSGQRASMDEYLKELGLDLSYFALASELRPDEQGAALCDKKIDGFVYSVGHPSANIQDPTASCNAKLISIDGPAVDRLVEEKPYYARATIPGGLYTNNPDDTHTYGVLATVISTTRVDEDTVYKLVKTVFENLEDFKQLHPALATLEKENMVKNGLTAPLHPGAERYYKEVGLITE
jgi:TRAP transporter TAXI family solute receptor